MKPDNSLNKPDPMAEDELEKIIHAELVRIGDMYPADSSEIRWSLQEISKAANVYTTNKIIEARIDELLYIKENSRDSESPHHYLMGRALDSIAHRLAELKALNHRKDES